MTAAEFLGEDARRYYRLTDAPHIEGVGSMRLTVAPTRLTIQISDGQINTVIADGRTVRRDGRDGCARHAVWTRHEWERMPQWLAEIVASTGIPLR